MIQAMCDKYTSGTHYLASSFWKDVDVIALQKFLANSTDNQLDKVYLTSSGSDGTEAAFKLIRQSFHDQGHETPTLRVGNIS